MTRNIKGSPLPENPAKKLRTRAEEKIGRIIPNLNERPSLAEARRLIQELQIHQVELEMQNEELRRTQEILEAERAHFFRLYDLAPSGYATINSDGLILETNFTAATLLGMQRGGLSKQPITRFIHRDDQDAYYLHRKRVAETGERQVVDLRMVKKDGTDFWSHIETTTMPSVEGTPKFHMVWSDITNHVQSTTLSAHSLKLLQAAIDHSEYLVSVKDLDGRFLMVSHAFATFWGSSRDRLIGKTTYDLFPTNEADHHHANDLKVLEQGIPHTQEECIETPDGRRSFLSTTIPLMNQYGKMCAVFGLFIDITERKNAEQALLQAHEYLEKSVAARTFDLQQTNIALRKEIACRKKVETEREQYFDFFTFSTDLMAIVDSNFQLLVVNPTFAETLGYSPEELTSHPFLDFLHPEDRQKTIEGRLSVFSDKGMMNFENRYLTKGREVVWLSWAARKSPVDDNRVYAIGRNVTDQKKTQQALQESEKRLREVLENSLDALYKRNIQTDTYDYMSPFFETISGYSPAEMRPLPIDALLTMIHPDDRPAIGALIVESMADPAGKATRLEYRFKHKNGSYRWFQDWVKILRGADGKPEALVGSVRDITEGKILQQRLFMQSAKLQQTNSALEEEIAERRNVEGQIKELNQSLEQRVTERTMEVGHLADHLRALASEITRAEQRERQRVASILHDHIQQLLVGAQMNVKRAKNPDPDIAHSAIEEIDSSLKEALAAARSLTVDLFPPVLTQSGLRAGLEWLARRLKEKNHFTVQVDIDSPVEPTDPEIRTFLFEASREVLLNAVKYSGVSEAHLAMSLSQNDHFQITIADKGKGFSKKLNDPGPIGGFGLFSIQQRLLFFGGDLRIETAPDKGTKVFLSIPWRSGSAHEHHVTRLSDQHQERKKERKNKSVKKKDLTQFMNHREDTDEKPEI